MKKTVKSMHLRSMILSKGYFIPQTPTLKVMGRKTRRRNHHIATSPATAITKLKAVILHPLRPAELGADVLPGELPLSVALLGRRVAVVNVGEGVGPAETPVWLPGGKVAAD